MDILRLRVLTKKSIVPQGKHEGCKVGDLLNAKRYNHIAWVYYCCSKISYQDEILEEVGIREDMRIKKPGKDLEMFQIFIKMNEIKFKKGNHSRGNKAVKVRQKIRESQRIGTKSKQQMINRSTPGLNY